MPEIKPDQYQKCMDEIADCDDFNEMQATAYEHLHDWQAAKNRIAELEATMKRQSQALDNCESKIYKL